MTTIVPTSEEDPILSVVRFVGEMSWADAGPEVSEYTRVYGKVSIENPSSGIYQDLWEVSIEYLLLLYFGYRFVVQ